MLILNTDVFTGIRWLPLHHSVFFYTGNLDKWKLLIDNIKL